MYINPERDSLISREQKNNRIRERIRAYVCVRMYEIPFHINKYVCSYGSAL